MSFYRGLELLAGQCLDNKVASRLESIVAKENRVDNEAASILGERIVGQNSTYFHPHFTQYRLAWRSGLCS